MFLSLEDGTGIANVIVRPDLYEKNRMIINRDQFLGVEGFLQNQDNVTSIQAARVLPIAIGPVQTLSHDFYLDHASQRRTTRRSFRRGRDNQLFHFWEVLPLIFLSIAVNILLARASSGPK